MIFRLLWKKTRPLSRLADFSSLFKAKMFEPSQSDLSCTLNLFSIMSQLHSPSVLNRVVSYVHICFYSVLNRILSLFSVLYLFSFLDHVLHNVLNLFWIMFSITFIVCYYLFSICVVCSESRPQSVLDASARSASDGEERSAETDDERRPASGYLSHPGVNITVRLFPRQILSVPLSCFTSGRMCGKWVWICQTLNEIQRISHFLMCGQSFKTI